MSIPLNVQLVRRLLPILVALAFLFTNGLAAPVSAGRTPHTTRPRDVEAPRPSQQETKDPPAPATPPGRPPLAWGGEYRLRFTHLDLERAPAGTASTSDNSFGHRLRLELTAPLNEEMIFLGELTTNARRWGDFDLGARAPADHRIDFERLLFLWKYSPQETLYLGRGAAAYFEADLAVASGRFNEEDVYYDGVVWERNPDPDTKILAVFSPLISPDPFIKPDPFTASTRAPDFEIRSVALNVRHNFGPRDRFLVHAGRLEPTRPVLGFGGDKGLTGLLGRYDHHFSRSTLAFGSVSLNLSQTDGVLFKALPNVGLDKRTSFFGGIVCGDRMVLHENVFEAYYTWTAPEAQSIFAEYPNDIREARIQWQQQVRPRIWLLASGVRRENFLFSPVPEKYDNTAYVQLLAKF